ncbi:MAG: hypothetical protein F6K24_03610 [Okeania sp. SIO2D1]|nr:hypothetical protein [Okeania sp. SIO2D1]
MTSTQIGTAATEVAFKSNSYGRNGGNSFTDKSDAKTGPITKISIRHGNEIDQIEVFYGGRSAGSHGGSGGRIDVFEIKEGYYIVGIRGRSGKRIDQLQFIVRNSEGKYETSPIFGGGGGDPFEINSPGNLPLRFIEGRSGSRLDQITFSFGYPYRVKNLKLDSDAIQEQLLRVTPSSIHSADLENPADKDLEGKYVDSIEISESHTFHWQLSSTFTYGQTMSVTSGFKSAEVSWSISVNATVGNSKTRTDKKTRKWEIPFVMPKHTVTRVNAMVRKAQLSGIPFTYEVEFYEPENGRVVKTLLEHGTYDGVVVSDITFDSQHTPLGPVTDPPIPTLKEWDDHGVIDGWTLKMIAFDQQGLLWGVGTEGNLLKANGTGWDDAGFPGGWTLKMIAFDQQGLMWGVGTEGNLGKANGTGWDDAGFPGGWTLKMIAFDQQGLMWGVGTEGNLGKSKIQ